VIFVSFSGIDGAGKSSQIGNLQARLGTAGAGVCVISFWDDIATFRSLRERASYALFKGERGVGSPERPIARRDKNVSSWYMLPIRLVLYVLDALHLNWVVIRALHARAEVVIFDRYIYDQFANLPLEGAAARTFVRCLLCVVPRPDVAYLLDANPSEARKRKPEYPLEFLRKNRERYLVMARLASMKVIDPQEAVEVERQIWREMATRLPMEALTLPSLSDL